MRFRNQSQEIVVRGYPTFTPQMGNADDPKLDPTFVGRFVVPRFTPSVWAQYLEVSTRLNSALDGLSQAAVGINCRGVADPDELLALGKETATKRRNRLSAAEQKLTAFCRRPKAGSFLPITHELVRAEKDWYSTGFFTLEIVEENREAGQPVVGLAHARSAYMRVSPERDLWVQALHSDTYDKLDQHVFVFNGRYYRAFGDDNPGHRFIDRYTGDFFRDWPAGRSEERKGTAILSGCSYSPLDPYYGAPVHVSALNAIMENDLSGKFMVAYLDGGTQVPLLFIVEGGQFTNESAEKIDAIFNSERGVLAAGRAATIMAKSNLGGQTPAHIRVERIELGLKDFTPLLARRAANDAEILETVRFSSVFLGGAEGGNTTTRNAGVLKQLTYEHAIEPRTRYWESLLTNAIAPRITDGAVFKIQRPNNLDPLQVASLYAKLKDGLNIEDLRSVARTLVNGIDIPVIALGADGKIPMALLDRKVEEAAQDPKNAVTPGNVRQLALVGTSN